MKKMEIRFIKSDSVRKYLLFAFIFLSTPIAAQNKYLSIGSKQGGICFGNSKNYNGIRLNIFDRYCEVFNGLGISGLSNFEKSNGVTFAVAVAGDSISKGVKIGGLVVNSYNHKGIALSGLFITGNKYSGIGLAGLSPYADTLNGLFAGLWGVVPWSRYDTIHVINGVAFGALIVNANKLNGFSFSFLTNQFDEQNGVSVSLINSTDELHGIQFGLVNRAKNNRRLFRTLPILNFNFKKRVKP